MTIEERAKRASDNFYKGYNCAQSLVLAFSDLTDLPEETLLKLASSFGAGMGRLREVCGAVSGMFMIEGLLHGYSGPETGDIKADHYTHIQKLAEGFTEVRKTLICRELLGKPAGADLPTPEARTESYYQSRPCAGIIADAARVLAAYLGEE